MFLQGKSGVGALSLVAGLVLGVFLSGFFSEECVNEEWLAGALPVAIEGDKVACNPLSTETTKSFDSIPALQTLSGSMMINMPLWALDSQKLSEFMSIDRAYTTAVLPAGFKLTGQSAEDLIAYENYFWGKGGGSFLELGALDGVMFSNTLSFSSQLGWKGVLLEASPKNSEGLFKNRPDEISANMVVCEDVASVHVVESAAVGGIVEFMSESFKSYFHPNLDISKVPVVPCLPLSLFLGKLGISHINFFSLDVEGGELGVLKSLDFDKVSFDVVVIEADGRNPEKDEGVRQLMISHNYKNQTVERNDWFIREGFVPSRKP